MRCCAAWGLGSALLLVLATGCGQSSAPAKEQIQARETFTAFQTALKAKNPDKIWELLAAESQTDADRIAASLKAAYAKADVKAKAEEEKKLGLTATELSGLTGLLFLKSNRFHGTYDEIPGSKFEKATVEGDRATVHYVEDDGDKVKLTLFREKDQWKVLAPMPRAGP